MALTRARCSCLVVWSSAHGRGKSHHPFLRDNHGAPRAPTDIATTARLRGATLGCSRELRTLEAHLGNGEKVRRVAAARHNQRSGLLVLTGRRLLFIAEGWFRKAYTDLPIARMSQMG